MIEIQRDGGEIVTIRSLETIGRLLDRGDLTESTLVRNQGESDFIPARDHPGIAGVASMVGKPFTTPEPARPTDPKVAQTHPPDISAQDPGVRPPDVTSTPTAQQKSSVPTVQPPPLPQQSPWVSPNGIRIGLGGAAGPSPRGPAPSRGPRNTAVRQPPQFHQALAPAATEPLTPDNAGPMARQEASSPTYGAPRAFGGALIRHLIAFGVGMLLARIGSGLQSAGVFVFFGASVSALLGFNLGQKLHAKGARSSKAIGIAVLALSFLALDIAGGSGFIVAAVSGAAIFLGWNSKVQA